MFTRKCLCVLHVWECFDLFSAGFSFVPNFFDNCFQSSKHNVCSPISIKYACFFITLSQTVIMSFYVAFIIISV